MEASMFANRYSHFVGILFAGLALGVWTVGAAVAEPYPSRLIKLVVPFAAGSPVDIIARSVADKMSASLKQSFVIENRPGAGGNIGADVIAKAAPDGYTLGAVVDSMLTVNPSLYKTLPFDPDKDLRPISLLTTSGLMLVVHPSVPVNSVAEFVAFAKTAATRKRPIIYGSGGNGLPGHLVMEKFRLHAGFEAIHAPYRGNPPMVIDLVAGQIKVGFVVSAGMMDHVQTGRLKALAVSRSTRSPLAPNVPTIAESGYPGFSAEAHVVLLAPAGIPESIADRLEHAAQAALKHPDAIERFRRMDTTPAGSGGAEARAKLKAERAEWAKVVAAGNLRIK
jgi:tripartite-type tricarboxylate transporter receptor subunit TctC